MAVDLVAPGPGAGAVGLTGSALDAADRSIRLFIVTVVPLWLIGILTSLASAPQDAPLAVALIGLGSVVVAHAGYAWRGWGTALTVTLAVTAVAVGLASPTPLGDETFPVMVPWLTMAASVTGALCLDRRGPLRVAVVCAAVGAAVWVRQPLGTTDNAALLAHALACGLAVWAGLGTLRGFARQGDAAAAALAAERTRSACRAARAAEVRRTCRQLHDTVVNTLGAIRGLPIGDVDLLRQRCAEDLEKLATAQEPSPSVNELFNRLSARARLLGLALTITASGIGTLPRTVAEGLEATIGEAMLNASKHSGSRSVALDWQWDGSTGTAELSDDGRGFPSRHVAGAVRASMVERCREAGIAVQVLDRDGAVVRLSWVGVPTRPSPSGELEQMMGHAAGRVATVVVGLGLALTALAPPSTGRAGSVATLVLLSVLVAWTALVTIAPRAARLPWPLCAVLAPVAVVLPGLGAQGCERVGWSWWGPAAGVVVVLCAVLVDGRPVPTVAASAGLVAGFAVVIASTPGVHDSCGGGAVAILAVCLGIVVALVSFRQVLARQWRRAVAMRGLAAELAARDASTTIRDAVRARELSRARTVCSPLLAGIAEGRLDPRDASVRERCARAEAVLRSVIGLGPELGPVADVLRGTVLHGAARGVAVAVRADGVLPGNRASAEALGRHLGAWVGTLTAGSRVDVTVLGMPHQGGAAPSSRGVLVATCRPPSAPRAPLPPEWACIGEDDLTSVEAHWDAAGWIPVREQAGLLPAGRDVTGPPAADA